MIQKRGLEYLAIGIDSSNHGTDPEIYVAVASPFKIDSQILPNFEKVHDAERIEVMLRKRDYRFMIVSRRDYERCGEHHLIVNVCKNLVCSFSYFDTNPYFSLEIFVDGELQRNQRQSIKEMVSKQIVYPPSLVSVHAVPKEKSNKTNRVIAIADGKAHCLFRHKTLGQLTTAASLGQKRASLS